MRRFTNGRVQAGLAVFALLSFSPVACAYSVLTHEAIIDALWNDAIRPVLINRFPAATEEQLREAHGYAYGGCLIQDLGYYPFGSHFFSDLLHYVRSADFLQALLDESHDLQEYAFGLGAVAHYGADVAGHSIAVNRAVPLLYPELRKRFGNEVTYGDDPKAHLKTEFGFDVLQLARGHYAPQGYHDFIGFQVSKDLLDRAFQKTYGLKLKDLFRTLELALGAYRFSVSRVLPAATKAAWSIKSKEIMNGQPTMSRKLFLYNIKRASLPRTRPRFLWGWDSCFWMHSRHWPRSWKPRAARSTQAATEIAQPERCTNFWLPETDTDSNSRMENFAEGTFSCLLTKRRNSDLCPEIRWSRGAPEWLPKNAVLQFFLRRFRIHAGGPRWIQTADPLRPRRIAALSENALFSMHSVSTRSEQHIERC